MYYNMPYAIVKVANGKYKVYNKNNGRVHSKHTTLANAKAQVRLLGFYHGSKLRAK